MRCSYDSILLQRWLALNSRTKPGFSGKGSCTLVVDVSSGRALERKADILGAYREGQSHPGRGEPAPSANPGVLPMIPRIQLNY